MLKDTGKPRRAFIYSSDILLSLFLFFGVLYIYILLVTMYDFVLASLAILESRSYARQFPHDAIQSAILLRFY